MKPVAHSKLDCLSMNWLLRLEATNLEAHHGHGRKCSFHSKKGERKGEKKRWRANSVSSKLINWGEKHNINSNHILTTSMHACKNTNRHATA